MTFDIARLKTRDIVGAGDKQGLFNQWACMPIDATEEELQKFTNDVKEFMTFQAAPDEFVTDRFFGGFSCPEPGRTHVLHAGLHYSYIAAGDGIYDRLTEEDRRRQWYELAKENEGQAFYPEAPFTKDFPMELLSEEGRLQAPQEQESGDC